MACSNSLLWLMTPPDGLTVEVEATEEEVVVVALQCRTPPNV